MARIRSVHPGIWTDEDFASLSMAARVLYFGILTEADDHGVFEWKPTGLKMRIFPGDNLDPEPLLAELVKAGKVSRREHDGREYGLVRNFLRFQRPKKPSYRFAFDDEWRTYVGLADTNTEPVENQSGTGGEIPPQMKEEGWRMEEGEKNKKDSADAVYAFEQGVIRLNHKDFDKWKAAFSHLDLPAELIALAPWAEQQGKNWFHAVPNALAKRNREAKNAKEKPAAEAGFKWLDGIEGVL